MNLLLFRKQVRLLPTGSEARVGVLDRDFEKPWVSFFGTGWIRFALIQSTRKTATMKD